MSRLRLSRLSPPTEASFTSRLRSPAVAARVGVWLGICFGTAFVTGLISHYAQQPHQSIPFPTSPAWIYRVTQGLHVVSGTAAIPLLLVKLWSVFPQLLAALPRHPREMVLTGLERGSIAVLVASAIAQLATGLLNVSQWYAWDFNFRRTHYALAWVAIGALLVHIAVKLPIIRDVLGSDIDATVHDRPSATVPGPITRRGLLRITWMASTLGVLATAVGTFPVVRRLSLLSARDSGDGIPINRTARQAGVVATATSASWRCTLVHGDKTVELSRAELTAMPQSTHTLPIACVEGWSASGTWTGVPLRDLLDQVGAPRGSRVRVTSVQEHGPDRHTDLPANFVDDRRTLLALSLNGEPLALDHGYPARLIAPDRPGALQTKWVGRIEVLG